jgi:hypothetical protein
MPAVRARERLREGLRGLDVDTVMKLAMEAYDDEELAQSFAEVRMKQIMDEKSQPNPFAVTHGY